MLTSQLASFSAGRSFQTLKVVGPKGHSREFDLGRCEEEHSSRYKRKVNQGTWDHRQGLLSTSPCPIKTHASVPVPASPQVYKGRAQTVGRWSDYSLYSEKHVTFEDDAGAYNQKDAAGFIKINALRLKLLSERNKKMRAKS